MSERAANRPPHGGSARALEAELAELEGLRRKAAIQAIKTAREFGDLSENFEYHAAKNEQGLLEARIRALRERLNNAVTVEHDTDEHVGVGSVVGIEDEDGDAMEVEISAVGGVSPDSPLGSALLGAAVGDVVDVQAPSGSWKARVAPSDAPSAGRQSRRIGSPVATTPGVTTRGIDPAQPQPAALWRVDELQGIAAETRGELRAPGVRLARDLDHRFVAQCEPSSGRQAVDVEAHVDEEVVAGERPAIGSAMRVSRLVDASVSWFSRFTVPSSSFRALARQRSPTRPSSRLSSPVAGVARSPSTGRTTMSSSVPAAASSARSSSQRASSSSRVACRRRSSGHIVPAVLDVGEPCPVRGVVRLARDLGEVGGIDRREQRVAVDVEIDLREQEGIRDGKRLPVDLCSSDHEYGVLAGEAVESLRERARALGAFRRPGFVARDDDVAPPGQRAEARRAASPRSSPHDDRRARRGSLEVRQVLGQAPGDAAVAPDHAVAGDRGDDSDGHAGLRPRPAP